MTREDERKIKTFVVKVDAWQKLEELKHMLETIDDRIYFLKNYDNEEAEELRAHFIFTLQDCAGKHEHRAKIGL